MFYGANSCFVPTTFFLNVSGWPFYCLVPHCYEAEKKRIGIACSFAAAGNALALIWSSHE